MGVEATLSLEGISLWGGYGEKDYFSGGEDDSVLRDMLRGVLAREYTVLEASSYSEAQKRVSKSIDLALIDYSLPDGDGFDVLRTLREVNPALSAIIMTEHSLPGTTSVG